MSTSLLFNKKSTIKSTVKEVFKWHERLGAFDRLTPPWIKIKKIRDEPGIHSGAQKVFKVKIGLFWKTWHLIHEKFIKDEQFTDKQIKGPFKSWMHLHKFKSTEEACIVEERIQYKLPFHSLTKSIFKKYIHNKLKRLFAYRHEILKKDLHTHHQPFRGKALRILIAGGSGFIGTQLKSFLQTQGHEVIILSRQKVEGGIQWDVVNKKLRPKQLENFDAVINLGGCPILGFWTDKKKKDIRESRLDSTQLLVQKLAKTKNPPRVFISASGINIYGYKREEKLHERSSTGSQGFLTQLCHEWEAAANEMQKAGTRVVNLRIGMVLSPGGGALKMMLPAFKGCIGGRIGSGLQCVSWIAMDDILDIIYYCILNPRIGGPVNATAPHQVTNFAFKQALAKKMNRPAWMPVPSFLIRLILGQMGKETLLSDLKVQPQKLLAAGYKFRYPRIEQALKHILE